MADPDLHGTDEMLLGLFDLTDLHKSAREIVVEGHEHLRVGQPVVLQHALQDVDGGFEVYGRVLVQSEVGFAACAKDERGYELLHILQQSLLDELGTYLDRLRASVDGSADVVHRIRRLGGLDQEIQEPVLGPRVCAGGELHALLQILDRSVGVIAIHEVLGGYGAHPDRAALVEMGGSWMKRLQTGRCEHVLLDRVPSLIHDEGCDGGVALDEGPGVHFG